MARTGHGPPSRTKAAFRPNFARHRAPPPTGVLLMSKSTRSLRLLAAGATTALVVPAAIAFAPPASASVTTDTGDANSTATVLSLTAVGHNVKAIVAALNASTITSPKSAVVDVVPVTLDGTKYGEQKITNGGKNVAANTQSVLGAVGVTTPTLSMQADSTGPIARLTSAGDIAPSLLGITLPKISSTLNFGSSVVNKTSDASKTVHLTGLLLPSLRDLLGALGLDLSLVSTAKLDQLVNQLNLVTSQITSAEAAVAGLPAATADVATKTTALTSAITAAPFSNAAIVTLLGTLGVAAPATAADW